MQPTLILRVATLSRGEEDLLNLLRHHPARTRAYFMTINLSDRRHLRGCSREEGFVGAEQVFQIKLSDLDRVAEVAGNLHDGLARDAEQDRMTLIICQQPTVAHYEEIFAGAFGKMSIRVQQQSLGIAALNRIAHGEDRVQVLAAG